MRAGPRACSTFSCFLWVIIPHTVRVALVACSHGCGAKVRRDAFLTPCCVAPFQKRATRVPHRQRRHHPAVARRPVSALLLPPARLHHTQAPYPSPLSSRMRRSHSHLHRTARARVRPVVAHQLHVPPCPDAACCLHGQPHHPVKARSCTSGSCACRSSSHLKLSHKVTVRSNPRVATMRNQHIHGRAC